MTCDSKMCPQSDWADRTYAVVDIARNGQTPPDAVEVAVVPIVAGVIGESKTWLLCPDLPITSTATRIHGISNRHTVDAPPFARVENAIRSALDASVFVGHNALMDRNLLQRKLTGWIPSVVLSTMPLARHFAPEHRGFRLDTLADTFGLADDLTPGLHPRRTTYRALVTARLLVHLANEAGSWEELRRPGQPPTSHPAQPFA